MDDLDRKIVKLLSEDGRRSNKSLAGILKVSEGTIRNRIKRLVESGDFKISCLINPEALDDFEFFFLGIKVAVSRDLVSLAERVSEFPEVRAVHISTGRYDIILELCVRVKTGLIDFLSGQLANIDGIESTESFLVMKNFNKWVDI